MGKKLRVFQVARELNLSNEAVIAYLAPLDKSIKTQMSAVSEDLYDEICKEYRKETVTADTGQDFRQQLREKQAQEEMRRTKARMELEERLRVATQLAEQRPQRKKDEEEERLEQEKANALKKREAEEKKKREKEPEELSVVDLISKAKREIDEQKKAEEQSKGDGKAASETRKSKDVKAPAPVSKDDQDDADKGRRVPSEADTPSVQAKKTGRETREEDKSGSDRSSKPVDKTLKEQLESTDLVSDDSADKPDGESAQDGKKRKGKGKKKKKRKISEEEIQASIKQTLASMGEGKQRRRRRRVREDEEGEEEVTSKIKVTEYISVAELADLLGVDAGALISTCLELGLMVSINQRLDMDTIEAVADEYGFEVEKAEEYGADIIDKYEETEEDKKDAVSRPPVVTIMGHVDHGKTSLLDHIRKSSIISGEAGGITQHIGAYEVAVGDKGITFLDTPGHEAFTAMRARGAQATDLVVLIVAADDGVQPQTVEAINHALAAGVPIVVAINKIDKPSANPEMIKQQLAERNILIEEWGGKYQSVEMSAKTGKGVDRLLELILLEAEILELKANPKRSAFGVIIESRLDKGKGPVATVLVQGGTLRVGNLFVAGYHNGKVRAMYNERNRKVNSAPPSTPVQVIGFDGVPQAGDTFVVMETEREVKEISSRRQQVKREHEFRTKRHLTLDQISKQIKEGQVRELNVILKADVDGSNEALSDALMKLSNNEVSVKVIHKGVGGISESDVLLASASDAIIIGFHVRPTIQARELAKKEEIDVRLYDIIYSVVDDVKSALEGMLEPEITEELTSTIEVRETFKVPKVGMVAGSYVLSGKASRNDFSKVYREDKLIQETKIATLRRFKDDVREVSSGFECGITLDGFDDIKIGDIIETYKKVETARTL